MTPPSDNSFTLREPCCRAFLVSCASSLCRIFSWNVGILHYFQVVPEHGGASLEERLDEIGGRRFEFEDRQVPGQRGDVGDVPPLEVRDERRVDVLIANAVRHDVEPRVDEIFCLIQIKQMRRHAQAVFVGLVDDRSVHCRRHIGHLGKAHRTSGSRSIRKRQPVHPSLDHVDSHGGDLVYLLPRVVDRLSYDRCAGGVKTGPIERFAFLLVVHLDAFESVVAEALDGRDAGT